jgi:hypothetical protein
LGQHNSSVFTVIFSDTSGKQWHDALLRYFEQPDYAMPNHWNAHSRLARLWIQSRSRLRISRPTINDPAQEDL